MPTLSNDRQCDLNMNQVCSLPFDPHNFNWEKANKDGLYNHSFSSKGSSRTCGKLLAHCVAKVTALREKMGIRLCIFKIGVTSMPPNRFELYRNGGYSMMWILATSCSVDLVHMLEAALIHEFHKHVGCRNVAGSGGDGALNRIPPPPPPYFVYVAAARADQARRVL